MPASLHVAAPELLVVALLVAALVVVPLDDCVVEVLLVCVLELLLFPGDDELLEQPQMANGAIATPTANKFRVVNMRKPP